jgi:glycosyltransferase involved in cell wall biosynthesis
MYIGINAIYRMHGAGLIRLGHLLISWSRDGVDKEHRILLFTREENILALRNYVSEHVDVRVIGSKNFNLLTKLVWEQCSLPKMLVRENLDVLLCPGNIAPVCSTRPVVVVFDNAGPFCTSITPRSTGVHDWAWFKVLGAFMRLSAQAASRVIFTSQHSKSLFIERFGFPDGRGDVIYQGRETSIVEQLAPPLLQQLGIRTPYLLCVSHLYPYKNIPALTEGYALVRHALQSRGLRLVLVGKPRSEGYYRQLKGLIHRHGLDGWVVLTGGVAHNVIGPLLAGCEFFVFQSTCENCPTTLIEAMAAGLPIACSSAGVMPEIAGDAALYFDPYDPEDIAQALMRLAENGTLRAELRQKALQQSLKFPTWDEVGQMTLHSLRRAVGDC